MSDRVLSDEEIAEFESFALEVPDQIDFASAEDVLDLIATIRDLQRQNAELRSDYQRMYERALKLHNQNAFMLETLETYVRECRDCKDGYIDGLRCAHCWTARETLAKVRGESVGNPA
ncbi:hypothetical protein [Alicyclobacillus macrosporangiidus]|uniref:Regulator of replication initiation timing n=1 Tax=Alicyclobacillus macrosporangiidus TaxID=392015 RepID=A0A1I7ID19_9BACL|nr:hypothetical protein [Alicyclobacillus macrosporangiidus]SFU70798.1 hypothetical protein SAMN05421543_106144 [Alicyclobacillus macrosporangiidus]